MLTCAPKATLIISVYKDVRNLNCILSALIYQSVKSFDIIISEDGESPEMAKCISERPLMQQRVLHLTQDDVGFRKTRALNRAVIAARTELLVFIDGDCVPHPRFMEGHISRNKPRTVSVGRRVELGPSYSERLIVDPSLVWRWSSNVRFFKDLVNLHRDGAKNPEAGVYSTFLHQIRFFKRPPIVGCNFSANKSDLERVNGFNEEYTSIGTGEDTDLDWRLHASGCINQDVKHITPVFHLFHKRIWPSQSENGDILERSVGGNLWRCYRGLDSHRSLIIEAKRTAIKRKTNEDVLL